MAKIAKNDQNYKIFVVSSSLSFIRGVNSLSRYYYLVWRSSNKGKDSLGILSQGPTGSKKSNTNRHHWKTEIDIDHAFLVIVSASWLSSGGLNLLTRHYCLVYGNSSDSLGPSGTPFRGPPGTQAELIKIFVFLIL